jgi:hypothetical protein
LETVSGAAAPCGRMTLWHKMAILADDQLAEPADHGGDPDVALLQVLRPDGAVFAVDPLLARGSRVRGSLSRMLECVYPTWVRANLTGASLVPGACVWVVLSCMRASADVRDRISTGAAEGRADQPTKPVSVLSLTKQKSRQPAPQRRVSRATTRTIQGPSAGPPHNARVRRIAKFSTIIILKTS